MDLKISTDKSLLDIDLIFQFLHNEARWSQGIPRILVEKAILNSLCFGVYLNQAQIGFARVVTDCATFANLVDVFLVSEHRGKGFSRVLLEAINEHPDLQNIRRFMLATSNKKSLYAKFGFKELDQPEIFMEKFVPDVYESLIVANNE